MMRTIRPFRLFMTATLLIAHASLPSATGGAQDALTNADVLVVGAGISGLSAALEAARGGARVTVIEMSSVFGGHAVMSEGGVSLVGTPLQHSTGVQDSAELAYKDFMHWGEDVSEEWVRYYVNNSRHEVYDWLRDMGVVFSKLSQPAGNSVPRFHRAQGRGLGLVSPLYRECVRHPNITFAWNTQVTALTNAGRRVAGVRARNLRTGQTRRFRARAIILATGGFQSNLQLLRENWPKGLEFPDRILLGSGVNSVGLGHVLAQQAGAALSHMDYQWNYPFGIPDPRQEDKSRGLQARSTGSMWVNAEGKRFVNELASPKISFPAMLKQRGATYWAIFDEQTKPFFWVSGTDWGDFGTIQRLIFDNRELVQTAPSINGLAAETGLSDGSLLESVTRYNELVDKGDDTDFGRFGASSRRYAGQMIPTLTPPRRIEQAPFYAVRFFPLTRKSNGGVKVDLSCQVVDTADRPIPGLYAVGELTGVAGMNGKAGLEGVWLGPGIVMGRRAARAVLNELKKPVQRTGSGVSAEVPKRSATVGDSTSCVKCHDLAAVMAKPRSGYWHFEKAHRLVLERRQGCVECHAEMVPYKAHSHRINRLAQIVTCASCHVAE